MALGITNAPAVEGNKFLIYKEDAGKEYELAKQLSLHDLYAAAGPKAKDYVDLTRIMRKEVLAQSRLAKTLSKMKAPFTDMLQGQGGVVDINKNFVQWRVYGEPDSRVLMHGDANDPNIEYLGFDGATFKLWTNSDLFQALDVVAPQENKSYEMVIQSEFATPYQGGYLYDVILKDTSPGAFFERIYFQPGAYLIKMGALQSWEEIGSFGSLQLAKSFSYLEYRVPLTTMAWEFTVEGEAHRQWGSVAVMRAEGQGDQRRPVIGEGMIYNWIEEMAKMQIDYEKELSMLHGRSARGLIDPKTLKEITASPGLDEWFEYGQDVPYSPEVNSLDYIFEQLEAQWDDSLDTDNWSIEFLTGRGGLRVFNDWVKEKFGETAARYDFDFVLQTRTPFDNKYGRKGYAFVPPQFVEYVLPGYGSIRVAHWSALDDKRINGVMYPGTNLPVSSFEFIALNSGYGEPNIKKLVRTDNSTTAYECGFWSPWGKIDVNNPYQKTVNSDIGDRYKFYHRESFGLLAENPELLLRIRPLVSYK